MDQKGISCQNSKNLQVNAFLQNKPILLLCVMYCRKTKTERTEMKSCVPLVKELLNGTKEWYLNDQLHRIDGPAVKLPDGTKNGTFMVNFTVKMVQQSRSQTAPMNGTSMVGVTARVVLRLKNLMAQKCGTSAACFIEQTDKQLNV